MVAVRKRGRRRGAALAGAVALLALAGGGWWVASSQTALAVPVPLSLVQREDLGGRVLLLARETQDPTAGPGQTPARLAAGLAPRASLSGGAVEDVAAYAREAAQERSSVAGGAGEGAGARVELAGMSATRQLGGPLQVCARVRTTHLVDGRAGAEDVIPWVLTVDPGSQQITAVDVQHWDGGGPPC